MKTLQKQQNLPSFGSVCSDLGDEPVGMRDIWMQCILQSGHDEQTMSVAAPANSFFSTCQSSSKCCRQRTLAPSSITGDTMLDSKCVQTQIRQ